MIKITANNTYHLFLHKRIATTMNNQSAFFWTNRFYFHHRQFTFFILNFVFNNSIGGVCLIIQIDILFV